MDAQEFRKDFLENVKAEAAAAGEGSCVAFVNSMTQYLIDAEVLPDFIPSFYTNTTSRRKMYRVDGYAFDEFDYTMNLIIADYDGIEERTMGKVVALANFQRLCVFADQALNTMLYREIEMSTPCADLVDLLRMEKERIRKYRLLILTDADISDTLKNLDNLDIGGVPAECQIWNIDRVFRVCCSDLGRQNIEINFCEYIPEGIPCLEASSASTTEYNSYLCIIPGKVLADIYDKYGSQLLEGNVRSFLSTKVAVNKKIRETILKCPSMFFAYNNGVSATAIDVEIERSAAGTHIVSARDFQIINGGQTTASLSNTRHKDKTDLRGIYVQMKLTEIDESDMDRSTELVRNISRSSNSQNKVTDADFFSTHPFHIRMEQHSRRIFAPAEAGAQYETKWFYERAKGQFLQAQMRLTPAKKRQFLLQNPKSTVAQKHEQNQLEYTRSANKNKLTAILLSIFTGGLGIDRFYLGYTGLGVLKLLTAGGLGVWSLIDLIMICTGSLRPADGSPWEEELRSAQATSPSTAKSDASSLEALERLAKLHEQGALTDKEFQQKKADLLSKI